jgi:NAD+ kinase
MTIGIIANTTKINVLEVVSRLANLLKQNGFNYYLSDSLLTQRGQLPFKINKSLFINDEKVCTKSDIIISIGGDGTMLATAYKAQFYDKPVLGLNFGKLGFLAEVNINQMEEFIEEIKNGNYRIEERMVITGECSNYKVETLYAINDIVIDKGGWPKMIELTIFVGGKYVTTFAADGLIIATPTGSTGYSISTGGPIVSPKCDVITLSPISPHSLTVRPIVLPSSEEIIIRADSQHKELQVNCDGQRVFSFPPPLELRINKSKRSFKLIQTSLTNYFEILRKKLLWGIDLRKNSLDKEETI